MLQAVQAAWRSTTFCSTVTLCPVSSLCIVDICNIYKYVQHCPSNTLCPVSSSQAAGTMNENCGNQSVTGYKTFQPSMDYFWVARDLYYNLLTQFSTQSFDICAFSSVEDLGRADRNMSLILKIDLILKWMKSPTFLLPQ